MIDIVVTYLNGSDPYWIRSFNQYSSNPISEDSDECRYRDWEFLPYWFRSIENNAPWVNKIHFVVSGPTQVPKWLNLSNPKLHVVFHEDFIPSDCLPTFNSNAIEMHMHQIPGLSEYFIYFNDDFFLLNPTPKDRFVEGTQIVDEMLLGFNTPYPVGTFCHILMNNDILTNRMFIKDQVVEKYPEIFGRAKPQELSYLLTDKSYPYFIHFKPTHLPQVYRRMAFKNVWEHCTAELNATLHHRFRSMEDVNPWLVRNYQICMGWVNIKDLSKSSYWLNVTDSRLPLLEKILDSQTLQDVVINDTQGLSNAGFKVAKSMVLERFHKRWPTKSSFESFDATETPEEVVAP